MESFTRSKTGVNALSAPSGYELMESVGIICRFLCFFRPAGSGDEAGGAAHALLS
jgi:hypothetical protein